MERSLLYVTILPGSVTIDIVVVEIIIMLLIYHVASRGHGFKQVCDIMIGTFSY